MTLGFVFGDLSQGGIQRFVSLVTPLFVQGGHRVVFMTTNDSSNDVYSMPEGIGRCVLGAGDLPESRGLRLRQAIREHGIEVVFFEEYYSTRLEEDVAAARAEGAKVVIHHHNMFANFFLRQRRKFDERRQYEIFAQADAMIVLSHSDECYFRALGVNAHYIPNPVSDAPAGCVRRPETKRILWMARYTDVKRPISALRIIERVVARHPDAELVMLGKLEGDVAETVRAEVARSPILAKCVKLEGLQTDVWRYLANSAALLTTAKFEGFPYVIAEAAAMGVPVVGYALPYLEFAQENPGFIQTPQDDVDQAVESVCRLLEDREFASRASSAARATFERIRDFDQMAAYRRVFAGLQGVARPCPAPDDRTANVLRMTVDCALTGLRELKIRFAQVEADRAKLIARQKRKIRQLESSAAYRVGLAVTWPVRFSCRLIRPHLKGRTFNRCWAVGALAIWAFVLATALFLGEKSTDPAYFSYIGRCLNAGRHLYVDVWDCKGPVLYWMSAFGVWVSQRWGYTLLFGMFWAIDLLLLWALARRLGKNSGLAVFLSSLFAFGCGMDHFLVIGRQEALGVLFALMALHLDCRGRGRWLFPLAEGVCGGLAFMVKPTFAAFGVALFVRWLMVAVETRSWRDFAVRVGCAVAGGLSVLAACTVAYLPHHVCDFWNGALLWNLLWRVGNRPGGHWIVRMFTDEAFVNRYGWTAILLLALAAIAFFHARRRDERTWPLAAWLMVELALMLKVPDFFGQYVIVVSLPVILILSTCSRRVLSAVVLVTACVFAWKTVPLISSYYSKASARAAELERIRGFIENPSDPVAVCGGNRTVLVLNRLGLFSNQKYTFWEAWKGRSSREDGEEMRADFNRALGDPRCRILISKQQKPYLLKQGASTGLLDSFQLVYRAPRLEVMVFRKSTF